MTQCNLINNSVKGAVNSIQSLGTLDGPGIRFVVFTQGCNLRCGCCHNPDTWDIKGGTLYTAQEIVDKASRYRAYFGDEGGITLSGGEPLMQAEFATEVFTLAHEIGINTCLDTSGSILNDKVKALLSRTDRVLLDVKYSTDEDYKKYVGCSIKTPLEFLDYLQKEGIPTTLRMVIIPSLNDNESNIEFLNNLKSTHKCVDKIELLGFKKICKVKYDKMGLNFDFDKYDTPTKDKMNYLNSLLK